MEPMEPMKPMQPMKPLEPMKPMVPMPGGERWWPEGWGQPACDGARGGTRYACFPDARRLLVERDGTLTTYDTGDRRIGGVSQGGRGQSPAFTARNGPVRLDESKKLDRARGRGGAGTLDAPAV